MDRFEDLRTFVMVSDLRSVTRAAEQLGRAPSAVSRRVKDLEARLSTQLLIRTTRQITLTSAGERFHARAQRILTDLEEAEECANLDSQALSGELRLSAPLSFGIRHLGPLLSEFMVLNPALRIDIEFDDRVVELISNRMDLALRIGKLADSSLKSRRLAPIRSVVAASPDYLQTHGTPETPLELEQHAALCYSNPASPGIWNWRRRAIESSDEVQTGAVQMSARMLANNGDALVEAAINGLGVTKQPTFLLNSAIEAGQLVPILQNHEWDEIALFAVYPDTRFLPSRTRAFIDHLINRFGEHPPWDRCLSD